MKIVIAPDSFQDITTNLKAAVLMEQGAQRVFPHAQILKYPLAEGGRGTVEAVLTATCGNWIESAVNDPLGRGIMVRWGGCDDFAVIETAEASGLELLTKEERNPLKASSYGTGQLLEEALNRGYRKILIGLGGSAANDGGTGMARALGVRFLDHEGHELGDGGGDLYRLSSIDLQNLDPRIIETEFIIASDVSNPLLGPQGTTASFSRAKGATNSMQELLESGLMRLAQLTREKMGKPYSEQPGSGAAGGMGFGLMAFCGAKITSGIETVLDFLKFREVISDADLVLTGTEKIKGTIPSGSVLSGVARCCKEKNIPLLALTAQFKGEMEKLTEEGIHGVIPISPGIIKQEDLKLKGQDLILKAVERSLGLVKIGLDIE